MIKVVASVEAPLHTEDIAKRIKDAYGVSRAGSRISARIEEALHFSAQRQFIELRGGFVYQGTAHPIEVRDRSTMEVSDRKIELVSPEEIDMALVQVVRLGFSLTPVDAVASAISLPGFGRATQKISSVVEDRLERLTKAQRLASSNGALTLPPEE
ncbi:DUF3320 domain-containing protein [Hydrogenophaga taeniospiralis]|uniref:DUF3320 domain-containing protein n=1 Tax=Hydrogenophaga taeniospiralis TaxID=65656 RepID=UPI0039AFE0BF|nr:DUF3320 domain-containing protein [Hydrogenophaga taeniospiralis]